MKSSYGLITLLGSGETSLAGGRIFESVARRLPCPLQISALETPAGFELNSSQVIRRVTDFLQARLKNYLPQISIIPARKRGTVDSPDDPAILSPLASADLIFMGPGSPTYAVRQLKDSLAWDLVRARERCGAALVFASAATIAIGRWCLPVYEIYKVVQDVFSTPGLDLFADFGLKLSFIPHWNNSDGGAELDTSHCFIGTERFEHWRATLPPDEVVIGLDEHTGLTFDFTQQKCLIQGQGSVTLVKENSIEMYCAKREFPMSRLGDLHFDEPISKGVSDQAWKLATTAPQEIKELPPQEIMNLFQARNKARDQKDWKTSDQLRDQIEELGWQVQDKPGEQVLIRKNLIKRD